MMFKIDFHCHTKKIKNIDTRSRELSEDKYDEFIDNAIKQKVKIIGITNHNDIDFIQFEKLMKKAREKNLLIFPGIELDFLGLDVKNKNSRHSMNVIFNSDEIKEIKEWKDDFFTNEKKELISPEEYQKQYLKKWNEILENKYFKNLTKIILLPNNEKRSNDGKNINNEELKKIIEKIKENKKSQYILETNKEDTIFINKYELHPFMIGTDGDEPYKLNFDKVTKLPFSINSFKSLFDIFKLQFNGIENNAEKINSILNYELISKKTWIPDFLEKNKWLTVEENGENKFFIPIFRGINILFGGFGSGKTLALKSAEKLYSEYIKNANLKISLENKNNSIDFENIIKEIYEVTEQEIYTKNNQDIKLDFMNLLIKDIDNMKNNNINVFVKELKAYSMKIMNNKKWEKILGIVNIKKIEKKEFKTKIEEINNNVIEKINSLNNDKLSKYSNSLTKFELWNNNQLSSEVEKMKLKFIKSMYFEKKKEIFKYIYSNFLHRIINQAQESVIQFNNAKAKPNEMFFAQSIKRRLELLKEIKFIKKFNPIIPEEKKKIEKYKNKEFFFKPYVLFNKKISHLEYSHIKIQNFTKDKKNNKKIYNDFLDKINFFDKEIKNNKNYFLEIEELKEFEKQINKFENKNEVKMYDLFELGYVIVDEKDEICNPSDGQKKTINLKYFLKNNKSDLILLDEPEASLDNHTIMESIVHVLNEVINQDFNKTIIIATHNANILNFTKAINIIYRDNSKYETYIGNIFDDELENFKIENNKIIRREKTISRKEKMLQIIEGGDDVFDKRCQNYYGKNYRIKN